MGLRAFTVRFANVSVAAVQDLIAIYCGASMAIELHGIVLGQISQTSVEELQISIKRLPATVTAGSGGSAPSVRKASNGSAAATVTARANDTTQATTSGTAETLHSDTWNLVNGYQFFWPEDDRPDFGLSQACVLSLDSAPAAARMVSGTLYFAERF